MITKLKMCAVCGFVLDEYDGKPMHSAELAGRSDHVAVPIDYDPRMVRSKCDFCGLEVVLEGCYTVVVPDFRVPVINHTSQGNWLACPECVAVLMPADPAVGLAWGALRQRVSAYMTSDDPLIQLFLQLTYAQLSRLTREIRPWRPGDEDPT